MLVVTRRRGWLTLAGVGLIVVAIIFYGFLGRIPIVVQGSGMLIGGQELYLVELTAGGRIVELNVAPGDQVTRGEVIALLQSTQIDREMNSATQRFALLKEQNQQLTALEVSQLTLATVALERDRESLEQDISSSLRLYELKSRQVQEQAQLLQKGYIAENTYIQTLQDASVLEQQILTSRAAIDRNRESYESTRTQINASQAQRIDELSQSRFTLEELHSKREVDLIVRSQVTGVVVGVRAHQGAVVAGGDSLIEIQVGETDDSDLRCVAYISLKEGKKAHVGMRVEISPSVAERSRYGYIEGEISKVSEYVAASGDLLDDFGNESFVAGMEKTLGPVVRVEIKMEHDPDATSGYKWSTEEGYPLKITAGTAVEVKVITQEQRPVSYVIPWLRRQLGN
jgi:HlyD family secretion protein